MGKTMNEPDQTLVYQFINELDDGRQEIITAEIRRADIIQLLVNTPLANVTFEVLMPEQDEGLHFREAS